MLDFLKELSVGFESAKFCSPGHLVRSQVERNEAVAKTSGIYLGKHRVELFPTTEPKPANAPRPLIRKLLVLLSFSSSYIRMPDVLRISAHCKYTSQLTGK